MKIVYSILVLSFLLLSLPNPTYAKTEKPNNRRPTSYVSPSPTSTPQPTRLATQSQNLLTEGRLRSCQAKEDSIKNRMTTLINLVTKMQENFDTIATRVKDYYTTKVIPSGKTVPEYDTLLSTIQTKKDAIQTAVAKAQTNANNFNCEGGDPKGLLTQFRVDMQAVKKALQEYRTSIKNLIVAVRTTTESPTPTTSPTPTP